MTAEESSKPYFISLSLGGGTTAIPHGVGSNVVDMLEIPGKGRCYVYFARYSYEPFNQSLNDNPESELPLTAGDYVLVWGGADEDGYLEGELLDGRKGLIPMNFTEKLTGKTTFWHILSGLFWQRCQGTEVKQRLRCVF